MKPFDPRNPWRKPCRDMEALRPTGSSLLRYDRMPQVGDIHPHDPRFTITHVYVRSEGLEETTGKVVFMDTTNRISGEATFITRIQPAE